MVNSADNRRPSYAFFTTEVEVLALAPLSDANQDQGMEPMGLAFLRLPFFGVALKENLKEPVESNPYSKSEQHIPLTRA